MRSVMKGGRTCVMLGLAAMFCAAGCGLSVRGTARADETNRVDTAAATELGLSYPPLRNAREMDFTAVHMRELGVRLLRTEAHWIYREPAQGRFYWGPMDARLDFLDANGFKLWLTLSADAPGWVAADVRNERSCVPVNTEDFRRFVTALMRRYAGRIARIQFGNEWQTDYWYAGTAADYVRFHNMVFDIAKEHSPETQVALGGFAIGALRALAAMEGRVGYLYNEWNWQRIEGADLDALRRSPQAAALVLRVHKVLNEARYDVLDLHLYDDAEEWPVYVDMVRAWKPGVPILVSEFGGPNNFLEPTDDAYHASRLEAYVRTLRTMRIPEAYYFKLVPSESMNRAHRTSSLLDDALEPRPGYATFRRLVRQP